MSASNSFQIQGSDWSISYVFANGFNSFFSVCVVCHLYLILNHNSLIVWEEIFTGVSSGITQVDSHMGLSCFWIWKNYSFILILDTMLLRREISSLLCVPLCVGFLPFYRGLKTQFCDTSTPYLLVPSFLQVTTNWARRQFEWRTQTCTQNYPSFQPFFIVSTPSLLHFLPPTEFLPYQGRGLVRGKPYWFMN